MEQFFNSILALLPAGWMRLAAWFCIVLIATIAASRLATSGLRRSLNSDINPLPYTSIIVNIVRGAIWLIGGSIILDTVFGFDVSSIITALGVGGIAISLGLQDTLSNLIGGLQLTFMHVISPGDHIRVGSDQGVVKDVGLRHTTIQNASGQIVIIPNSVLSKTSLVQMPPANVVSVPFAVATGAAPLDEDAAQIAEAATKAVAKVSKVISDPPCLVRFTEITEYGFKGTATLKVEDPDLVSAALDAAVRAIAPFTR